ncbi:hypothetical protein [Bradyrhizobium sp. S3.5.5]|uniref:hypothetical protein n=1 Tax=Bradyrhizobium sp. S3.5.5 TaxID=3156430 RepID=UPI0033938CF2
MSEPIKLRIPYTQEFVRKRCRNAEEVRFWDEEAVVVIDAVEPADAPIAYNVSETDALAERPELGSCYSVRSYRGLLWWPLVEPDGFVKVDDFLKFMADGHEGALIALDPTIEIPLNVSPLSPNAYFEQTPFRTLGAADLDKRRASVQRGAAELMFCDGKVYVAAGEPLYYLVHMPIKGMLLLSVGAADIGRQGTPAVALPGPSSYSRHESACRGTAYAIGETEDEIRLQLDRGNSIFGAPKVEVVSECHRPDTAAKLCARVLAEFLWSEAQRDGHWTDPLRRSVPALGRAGDPAAKGDDLPHPEVLAQLAECKDGRIMKEFFREIQEARSILRRLRSFGHGLLTDVDDAALAALGELGTGTMPSVLTPNFGGEQ